MIGYIEKMGKFAMILLFIIAIGTVKAETCLTYELYSPTNAFAATRTGCLCEGIPESLRQAKAAEDSAFSFWEGGQSYQNIYGSRQYVRDRDAQSCVNNPCQDYPNQYPDEFSIDMPSEASAACHNNCEVKPPPGKSVQISFSSTPDVKSASVVYTGAECIDGTHPPSQATPIGVQYSVENGVPTFSAYGKVYKGTGSVSGTAGSVTAAAQANNPTFDVDVYGSETTGGSDVSEETNVMEVEATITDTTQNQATGTTSKSYIKLGSFTNNASNTSTTTTTNPDGTTTTSTTTENVSYKPVVTAIGQGAATTSNAVTAGANTVAGAVNTQGGATNAKLGEISGKLDGLGDAEFDEEALEGGGTAPTFSESLNAFYDDVQEAPLLSAVSGITFGSAGTCVPFAISTSFGDWSTDMICEVWETISPLVSGFMLFVWGFLGFRILMSA
jgi:hypothetical protein